MVREEKKEKKKIKKQKQREREEDWKNCCHCCFCLLPLRCCCGGPRYVLSSSSSSFFFFFLFFSSTALGFSFKNPNDFFFWEGGGRNPPRLFRPDLPDFGNRNGSELGPKFLKGVFCFRICQIQHIPTETKRNWLLWQHIPTGTKRNTPRLFRPNLPDFDGRNYRNGLELGPKFLKGVFRFGICQIQHFPTGTKRNWLLWQQHDEEQPPQEEPLDPSFSVVDFDRRSTLPEQGQAAIQEDIAAIQQMVRRQAWYNHHSQFLHRQDASLPLSPDSRVVILFHSFWWWVVRWTWMLWLYLF